MKKKFIEDKKFRLIVMLFVTVFIVTSFSFAWFIMRATDETQNFSAANFQAEPVCYFEGTEEKFVDEDGLITLSTNPEDANYIGKFRVRVKYYGDGWGYLRVKMVHEFSIDGVSVQHPAEIPYATTETFELSDEKNSVWLDNRSEDYCYYYKEALNADETETKDLPLILGLVKDMDEENEPTEKDGEEIIKGFAETDVEIKVAVETDMVQINRYPQIWGMEDLPWEE